MIAPVEIDDVPRPGVRERPALTESTDCGCASAEATVNAGSRGVSSRFGREPAPGFEILCTNPARLRGGAAPVDPMLPSAPFAPGTTFAAVTDTIGFPKPAASTAWLAFPDAFSARCSSEGGASALQISPLGGAPALRPTPDANWVMHVVDANIARGDLARLVRRQAARYARTR